MARLLVNLGGRKKFQRTVLNLAGVQRHLDRVTRRLEGESRARLARHRKTGDHGIRVYQDRHTRVIELFSLSKDGAPMSVQFGHWRLGKWVPGLNILPTRKGEGS